MPKSEIVELTEFLRMQQKNTERIFAVLASLGSKPAKKTAPKKPAKAATEPKITPEAKLAAKQAEKTALEAQASEEKQRKAEEKQRRAEERAKKLAEVAKKSKPRSKKSDEQETHPE